MNALACLGLAWAMRSGPTLFSRLYAMPWYRDELQAWAASGLEPGMQVLELGCASGELSGFMHGVGAKVTGVDKSPVMLARAQGLLPGPHYLCADATHLPFADAGFDQVMAASLLNLLPDPRAALLEWRRVLRPGGRLLLLQPACGFSDADLRLLLRALKLRGVEAMGLRCWHRLAKKTDSGALAAWCSDAGFDAVQIQPRLGGMLGAVQARVLSP